MNKFGNYLLVVLVFITISFCSISKLSVFNRSNASGVNSGFKIPSDQFRSGDIILREGKSFVSQVMRSFSQADKHYSHAGIIQIRNGQTYVCHVVAAEGKRSDKIRLEPIESFCRKDDNSSFAIYRTDLDSAIIDSVLSGYFRTGVSFDNEFDLNTNNKMYCTELVYKVLTIANRNEKFINLSHGNGVDYVACDNLYQNSKTKLIFSHNY
jgi:hypothetical protein